MRDRFDFEEDFHAKDRKHFRKERKHLQETDRSKYKKTDQGRARAVEPIDESLPRGRVMAITGEGIWIESESRTYLCTMKGLLKKEKALSKNLVVVGDWVRFEAANGNEGIVAQVEPRFSYLGRTDISGKKEQLIAANIDQVFIVVAVVEPELRPALIDRYLIAAEKGNIHPIIVVNKIDLLPSNGTENERYREFVAAYETLGFPILSISTQTGVGMEAIRSLMKDKTSVVAGQSGVGKSSLLNAAFQMDLRTGEMAAKTYKGTHTTTVAELLSLPGGGFCVDTPGVRSFGLWDLSRDEVVSHFHEIGKFSQNCRFSDCTHISEPHCAVLAALKQGDLPLLRYESYTTLLDEATGGIDNRGKRLAEQSDE